MNKFTRTISSSNKELKGKRGERLGTMLSGSQATLVQRLMNDVMQLENKIEDHTDLGLAHTTQLKFNTPEDGNKWVNELQDMKVELFMKKRELKIAKSTTKEWFTEEKIIEVERKEGI